MKAGLIFSFPSLMFLCRSVPPIVDPSYCRSKLLSMYVKPMTSSIILTIYKPHRRVLFRYNHLYLESWSYFFVYFHAYLIGLDKLLCQLQTALTTRIEEMEQFDTCVFHRLSGFFPFIRDCRSKDYFLMTRRVTIHI